LGRSGTSILYEGFDPAIVRPVAVKTIPVQNQAVADAYRARFRREAQSAGVLAHPNIVTVYDFGEEQGVIYLVTELLKGKSLETLLEQQTALAIPTIVPFFQQIATALDYAHQRNIVHGDLKPANIMICEGNVVKVMGFGVAQLLDEERARGSPIEETPQYMSPEQARGSGIDARSDVFSLGTILYESVTGEKAFYGQNATTVKYKISNQDPIPPRQLDPSIHPGLSYIVSKALAKLPEERYQGCAELAEDLKRYKNLGGAGKSDATMVVSSPLRESALAPDYAASQAASLPAEAELAPEPVEEVPGEPPPGRAMSRAWLIPGGLFVLAVLVGYVLLLWRPKPASPPRTPTPRITPAAEPAAQGGETPSAAVHNPPIELRAVAKISPIAQQPKSASPTPIVPKAEPATQAGEPVQPRPALATAPANPHQGQLSIDANLAGASVVVNGVSRPDWVTPHTFPLNAGAYRVSVVKPGYDTVLQTLTVKPGETTSFTAQLEQPGCELEMVTDPPGLQVFIDDKPVGVSPTSTKLPAGRHAFRVTPPPGDAPAEGTVDLPAGGAIRKKIKW
jgi:serine/threonine-protein kinase